MNYLSLENVTKSYGDKVLFKNINLQISRGQKAAIVAKNGAGKSTLLRVIAGMEKGEGETCEVRLAKDIRFVFLRQNPEFYEEHTVLEAVLDSENPLILAVKEYENAMLHPNDLVRMEKASAEMDDLKAWDFEAKIKEILFKLNISALDQQIKHLSGGQLKRLAIAKMVIDEPEFIILDEPTNHLDLDMIEWLENYLKLPNITVLMVTHDRYFLERVCNQIIELDRGVLYNYSGNYSAFLIKKEARRENESIEMEKTKKLYKKELDWVRRQPKARSTKAKSRVDSFGLIEDKLANKRTTQEMQIDIKGQRLGKKILEAHHISKSFGDITIVKGFSYKFQKKEKVGIIGPNGVGKTTFLEMLTGALRPDEGKVVVGANTVFGYYTQDGIALQDDKRVIDVIRDIAEFIPMDKGQKLTAEQLLERFLFPRKQQQVFVSQLSGGERRRLYLLTILMENPNFLILDEPTNDLDIMTLNVLEDFLMEFPGCVIIISHDRYFMDKLVDHLFIFEGEGKIRDFNGDYTDYRVIQKEMESTKRSEARKIEQETKDANKVEQVGLSYEQRKQISRLEKQISKLEEKKSSIEQKFTNPDITPEDISKLSKELAEVKDQIEDKEMEWMELVEEG